MGINDSKDNLNNINKADVFFRLDCELDDGAKVIKLVFVRSDETLVLQYGDSRPIRFDGINANHSYEYGRYKDIFSKIIAFDLVLQKQSELISAPLEAAILPYYISQSVGWVYIRESIGDYRFYRDFKFDYLDYYCGITSGRDRINKYKLDKEKKELVFELKQLDAYETNNEGLRISKTLDDRFKGEATNFLEEYQSLESDLASKEAEHTMLCNKIGMLRSRHKVLSQIISNIKNQIPRVDQCPTCEQILPGDLRDYYNNRQDINDAIKESERVKESIKLNVSKLNSAEKSISTLREKVEKAFRILRSLEVEQITFDSWMDHNANLRMLKNISTKKQECRKRLENLNAEIKGIGDDIDIALLRKKKEKDFFNIFKEKAALLDVKIPKEEKYENLYSINSFPYQGVELHQLLMAYNFSFYEMVMKNPNVHSLPFLLDAIFKEDIDIENRNKIFEFLSKETKSSGQVIFSVAEYKEIATPSVPLFDIANINSKYFNNNAKLICIGDGKTKRAFLSESSSIDRILIDDTVKLLELV